MDILFLSKRIYLGKGEDFLNGGIVVSNEGIVRLILHSVQEVNSYMYNIESESVFDFGDLVLMPGLIDSNVNINEPGRKDWEGFLTATKAAAAGGYTTIIDCATNAIPPTTNMANFKFKTSIARGKIYVDVGFWGGIVPDNVQELEELAIGGVVGFQCYLCPTVMPDFGHINATQLRTVLETIDDGTLIAVHPELEANNSIEPNTSMPKCYESFLETRPMSMEVEAIKLIAEFASKYKTKRFHVLNISSGESIPLIKNGEKLLVNVTVETCPHYLTFCAEEIEDYHTELKTYPPIRNKLHQEKLWRAIQDKTIDMIVSAHSPSTPGIKCFNHGKFRGDFFKAYPGVASLQLSLPIFWTHCQKYGLHVKDIYQLMCENQAKMCGIQHFKGKIEEGFDADFCIWNPDEEFLVTPEIIEFKNKNNPYINQILRGVVHATVVRGIHVFQKYEGFGQPLGKILLRKTNKKIVKFVRL